MNEWTSFIALAALIIGLFAWLRQDIKTLGNQLRQDMKTQGDQLRQDMKTQGDQLRQDIKDQSERIDKLNDRLGQVEQGLAALKATVETFFRLRVDPPDPDPDQRRTGTDG